MTKVLWIQNTQETSSCETVSLNKHTTCYGTCYGTWYGNIDIESNVV